MGGELLNQLDTTALYTGEERYPYEMIPSSFYQGMLPRFAQKWHYEPRVRLRGGKSDMQQGCREGLVYRY